MSATQPQQLIQKLLKAEEEAAAIITRARENRARRLRDAKNAAEDEIAAFRRQMEEKFQAEYAGVQTSLTGENEQRDRENEEGLETVRKAYTSNGGQTAKYMTEQVLKVKPVLSNIQVASLQSKAA